MRLLRFLFLFTIGFIYADCEQYSNEADCIASAECEWHADEMACEDIGHDDHGHECEDCMTYCVDYVMVNYGYTEEEGSSWCLSTSTNAFGCAELCSDQGDDHDDHDHETAGNMIEVTGLSEGATTFTLSIIHDGHADYTSMPIYIDVHGDEGGDDDDNHNNEEEHCEDFLTEADCGMHAECEWHTDDMACEDAESDDHDDHDHGDCGDFDHLNIDGVSLEHDGMVVYSQFQGYITGSLQLHVDERMDFTVHFIDANGNEIEFTEENPASCFPLGFEIDDPSIVSIEIEENHDDHDDHDDNCISGDANMDGTVNVNDIVLLVGFIVGNNSLDSSHECADFIHDGNIDVLDIVALVAVILGERGEVATSAEFTQIDNVFEMNANGIVGAVQITLSHGNDFEIELTNNALVAEYHTDKNTTTLIVVNPENDIFTTNNDYVIEEIIAATTEGYIATSWTTPGAIELSNAYPNPFNPSTSFNLNVSSAGFVSLNVYNLNGQLVDVIFEGNMDAGIYNMTWNGAELSSGIYILQAVSAEQLSTQKLTLLK